MRRPFEGEICGRWLRASMTAWAAIGVTIVAALLAGARTLDVVPGWGVRAEIAAVIAILGLGGLLRLVWDARRATLIHGRVLGYDRRESPDGLLDHPVIEYTDARGRPAQITSTFGIGIAQKAAPWPVGATATVRSDGRKPRHHSPMTTGLFIVIGTVFLITFVLAIG